MTHDELLAELDELDRSCSVVGIAVSALRAVVELHSPFRWNSNNYQVCCIACDDLDDGDVVPATYPCPTIQAIEKELA